MRYLSLLLLFISLRITAQIPAGYYDDADGLEGTALRSALHNIIDNHTEYSYDDLRDFILRESDEDPNNSNNVILLYTGRSQAKSTFGGDANDWNREHVWAKSHGGFGDSPPHGTDAHHLRPTDASVNSNRGNLDFDNGGTENSEASGNYSDSDSWEPRDAVKGDVARMLFYMAVRYEGDAAGELDLELVDNTNSSPSGEPLHGKLSALLEWHVQDPPDDFERNRNEVVYSYQGNRNPFIDHPEYVACIWQNDCGGGTTPLINVTENLVDFGTVAFGNVSSTQSYTVSASDLTTDLIITSSDSYQISETDNDADFTNTLSYTPTSGTVSSKTIFVRFNPSSDANTTINGTITHTSTGAASDIINVSGVEESATPNPELILTESITNFGTVAFGSSSATQSYTLNASNLTADLEIVSTASFEISLVDSDADYSSSISITPTSGSIANEEIFVRFKPSSNSNDIVTGSISHTSAGLSEEVIDLSGTEEADPVGIPQINFNFTQLTIRNQDEQEVKLFSDIAPAQNLTVEITLNSATNITASDFISGPVLTDNNIILEWLEGETQASFTIKITNATLFENGLDKNLNFMISNSSGGGYSVGSNNAISITIEGSVVSGMDDLNPMQFITYPNPAKNVLHVKIEQGEYNYSVMDLTGRNVLSGKFIKEAGINVTNLNSGSYILILSNQTSKYTSLFIKQ